MQKKREASQVIVIIMNVDPVVVIILDKSFKQIALACRVRKVQIRAFWIQLSEAQPAEIRVTPHTRHFVAAILLLQN